jgi:hypothetical protein
MSYTIRPTDTTANLEREDFLVEEVNEAEIVAICRDEGWTGAHVLYETNYCGWIDAREETSRETAS